MEKQIRLKDEYSDLDQLLSYLKSNGQYDCSKEYDIWDQRTDENGQLKQCVLLKKSAMHGMKVYFSLDNSLKMTYIIPNKIVNAYLGKSQKKYRSILEIIAGKIGQALLSGSQQKAFEEIELVFAKIKA